MSFLGYYLKYSLLMVLLSVCVVLAFTMLAIIFNNNNHVHFDLGGLVIAFILLSLLGIVSNTFAFGSDMIKKTN